MKHLDPIKLENCKAGSLYIEEDSGKFCLVLAKETAQRKGDEVICQMFIIGDFQPNGSILPRANGNSTVEFMYNTEYPAYAPKLRVYNP